MGCFYNVLSSICIVLVSLMLLSLKKKGSFIYFNKDMSIESNLSLPFVAASWSLPESIATTCVHHLYDKYGLSVDIKIYDPHFHS
jgi:hypothetical protein